MDLTSDQPERLHPLFTQHPQRLRQSQANRTTVEKLGKNASMDGNLCKLLAPSANAKAKESGNKAKRTVTHPCQGLSPPESIRMILSTLEHPPTFFSAELDIDPTTLATACGALQDVIKELLAQDANIQDLTHGASQQTKCEAQSAREYLSTIIDALEKLLPCFHLWVQLQAYLVYAGKKRSECKELLERSECDTEPDIACAALGSGHQDIIFAAQRHLERVRLMFSKGSIFHNNDVIHDLAEKLSRGVRDESAADEYEEYTEYTYWLDVAESAVKPVSDYFLSKFGRAQGDIAGCDFEDFMKVIRTAHIFNPTVAASTPRGKAMGYLANLTVVPVITSAMAQGLRREWDAFVMLTHDSFDGDDTLAFFELHQQDIPIFAEVAQIIAIFPVSSAACERMFSLLRNMFGDKQDMALQDLVQASVMLAAHNRRT